MSNSEVILYTSHDGCICLKLKMLENTVWLTQLEIIINDLLRPVNLEVTFSADKEFMTIKNEQNILKFEQLSQGQKIFLSSIFKIAILLNKGDNSGILLIDEGFSSLDSINLDKFLKVLQSLKYQTFIIYQNIDKNKEDIHYINLQRKQGESTQI